MYSEEFDSRKTAATVARAWGVTHDAIPCVVSYLRFCASEDDQANTMESLVRNQPKLFQGKVNNGKQNTKDRARSR